MKHKIPKEIYLPHIHYTVHIRQFVKTPPELNHALAYVQSNDKDSCTIYMDLKSKPTPGGLSHELVHVLQFICLNRNIEFTAELEHCGYIMNYLMNRIMDFEYYAPHTTKS